MSDEISINLSDDDAGAEQDFEEICSDEVDRIVAALESLAQTTQSDNIRYFIDEAANGIYELVYDAEAEDAEESLEDDGLPHEEAA